MSGVAGGRAEDGRNRRAGARPVLAQWRKPFLTRMTTEYAIETEGLTKVFRSLWRKREFCAVNSVSLRVERGTTFGLLGPNGAGKTTFVKMLLSAVRPSGGSARLLGRDAAEWSARKPVGYLPENHRFPTYLTGRGMLDFYGALSGASAEMRRRRVPELIEMVGLQNWGDVRLRKYSKGMLQRLGLAQALLHEPELLILDEPSDGVDPLGRIQIRAILHALEQRGVTIFINSHLLVEVELFCREVAILHQGKVALSGKVKDLTGGKGYRLSAAAVPESVANEIAAAGAKAAAGADGMTEFGFASRDEMNRAIDLLRAGQCEIEAAQPSGSTLEEVFLRTVNN
jgi:ABC-2 type transport system ATP-binding protein